MSQAYLILSNGQVYEGEAIGYWPEKGKSAAGLAGTGEQAVLPEDFGLGELVFTTGMVGYLETLTDPSYAGQMILQGFPLIGNYGVIPEDFEGKCLCKGYIVRELCEYPSNFRSQYKLDQFLKEQKIPGICGIDTRQIVRTIREEGVMNAKLTASLPEDMPSILPRIQHYQVTGVVEKASSKEIQVFPAAAKPLYHIALMDYGAKGGIIRCLTSRGCEVTVFPATTPAETVLAQNPDGIMLSNGPGDPAENLFQIEQIRKMIGKKPLFGICLGHQLTALALGGETYKLHYGHRGGNQPVRRLSDGQCFITSQNHGYAVKRIPADGQPHQTGSDAFGQKAESSQQQDNPIFPGRVSFENANDGSVEGMEYPSLNAFTVQFHPEASSGPHDTEFLFDEFLSRIKEAKHA